MQTLENILDRQLEFRDNLLQQAETAFLEKWSKDLKSQMLKWCSNLAKLKIKPLVLNFDTFIEQATLIEILARIGEGNNAIEFEEEINPFEMKFDEAIAYALNKKPTLFSELDEITDKVKNNCFWIKRSTELTATEKVLKELQKSLENGGTFKEFMQGIDGVIDKVGMGTNGWYASNVYRTNMMTFYNSGTYKQQMDNITDKPYLFYDGIADNRQSKICQELDGKVYKATDPIWARIYPPNHYGCRSSVVAMSKEEVEAFGLTILSPTKAIKEMDLGGFEGNPFDSYWKKLEKNVKKREKNLVKDIPILVKTKDKGYRIDPNKVEKDTKKREFENLINNQYLATTTERQQDIANFTINNFDVTFKRITDPGKSCMASFSDRRTGKVVKCLVETSKEAKHAFSHEFGHAVDRVGQIKFGDFKEEFRKSINSFYAKYTDDALNFSDMAKLKVNSLSKEAQDHYEGYLKRVNLFKKSENGINELLKELRNLPQDRALEYPQLLDKYKSLAVEREKIIKSYLLSDDMDHQLSDIIDMIVPSKQGGELVILGHSNRSSLAESEIFAELFCLEAASTTNINAVHKLEIVEALFPDVYKGYQVALERLLKKIGGL